MGKDAPEASDRRCPEGTLTVGAQRAP